MRETLGPATGAAEREEPLQGRVNGNGHQETGWWPEPRHNGKKCAVALAAAVFLGLIITVIVLAVLLSERSSAVLSPMCPACPDGWIGYRGKCYYFSEAKGNWTYSRSNCFSLGASLAAIDTQQDLAFLLRYKGKFDHWIGLQRDPGQPWKWVNGTEFNHLFPITADGDCAYLTENGVSSLRCTSERHWICTNPDPFTKAKGG
ncbi:C-type lectin domain family 2 member D-like [Mauremys mutica]|uniref:C-type lectin domain family 2 member D-like n=1 Tax=Mauremys mutica TaxID=74926 RepID=UPI001D169B14|nr:C-type lectin domain family 2 member D-like [Mauremys mutica]